MTKVQKLAALLIVIGPEAASQVMKNLDEHELDTVAGEMAKMPMIPQELQRDILKEFTGVAVEASTCILGGVGYTQNALEKSVGVRSLGKPWWNDWPRWRPRPSRWWRSSWKC